jgi:hypothetical protein
MRDKGTVSPRFGTDKHTGTALRAFEGVENRRAWEAFLFCVHPRHHGARDAHGVDVAFTVLLPSVGAS